MTSPARIRVFSGGAPQGAFALLTPKFEQQSRCKVDYVFEVTSALDARLKAGETADVLVLPVAVLDGHAKAGTLRNDARATFGSIAVTVVVKEGAPKPDISTKEKFRAAMLAARSIVHATPGKTPSGTHLGKVMQELGIAEAIAKKTIHKPALDGGVEVVASGEAEIGIYPASEVTMVKGLAVVGPLPPGIDLTIVYGGAATVDSADVAVDFVRFMAAPENRATWTAAGFTPA
jgi:molybdate transport system substrate-binding protein